MTNELDIRSMELSEVWNTFKSEIKMEEPEYRKARFGVNIMFDINDALKGRLLIKPKTGRVHIKGKSVRTEDFETELELRERVIKDWLVDNFVDQEIATPRGIL